ncbi:hypothetical protein HDU86_004627 [Geranomyces michiganensis]|nr:hypothetical protein HDU86_004627 [Geranomyces michiganensis]
MSSGLLSPPSQLLSPPTLRRSASLEKEEAEAGPTPVLKPLQIFEPEEIPRLPSLAASPPTQVYSPPPPDPPPLLLPNIAGSSKSASEPAPDFVFVVSDNDTQTVTEQGRVAALPKVSVARLVEKDDALMDEVKTAKRRVFDLTQDVEGLKAALAVCDADEGQINQAIRSLISELVALISALPAGHATTTTLSDRLVSIADRYSKDTGASVVRMLQEQAAAAAAAAAATAAARSNNRSFAASTMTGFGGSTAAGLSPKRVLRGAASRLVMGDGLLKVASRMGSAANLL